VEFKTDNARREWGKELLEKEEGEDKVRRRRK
jgi:hypothetical protein